MADGRLHDELLLDSDVVLQLDENGKVIGIEIWGASKRGRREVAKMLGKIK